MTAPLRDLLAQLVDEDARASVATAPDAQDEARAMRTELRRLHARRVTALSAAAAAVVTTGVLTWNAVTPPPALLPAVPHPSPTVTASPSVTAGPTPTASPTPTPTATAPSPTATSAATEPPARPKAADVTHGNEVWGTYVAAIDSFDSPEARAAQARVTELGYEPSGGDVGCDQGAAEVLGLPHDTMVVSAYFVTEEDAALFAQMYGPDVLGIAQVKLFCLD